MTTVSVDQELKKRWTTVREPVLVCDEHGRRIGLFLPDEKDEELYRRARAAFRTEDLDRAEKEPGGTTLDEILAKLNAE